MSDLLLNDWRFTPAVHPPYAEAVYVPEPLVKLEILFEIRRSSPLSYKPLFSPPSHLSQIDLMHSFHSVFSLMSDPATVWGFNLTALEEKPPDKTLH